jgi:RNA polymerase sigma-54 factor
MTYQHEFLEKGVSFIKPMNILDVSSMIGMHESTVSRVTNGKYIATPWGVFELKYFLPSHIDKKDGGSCSSLSVKELIKQIIHRENATQIFSDDDITLLLKEQGIKIARRTVAKYRESMNILPSYQRAQIKFHQE